ncbi:autotransporter outer membrane beta-barrel domain-containing protein [Citrobacter portucalensis]|uniref:autotransporter outer membrane beta-barrel domain-containing protein n=1 Tax=Citrobacter portucalensis TaxID=1639133 RepID=UPI002112B8DD|nr:autotransporter outer membrane beta-barrel domain-containing protein [Citrobacter portucalensis]MCQ6311416.1 autotransporter outer membrane beta-barrel domain-containing protein [Citrobacter portucalensis]
MNKVFKVIWSVARSCAVVVSELACGNVQSSSSSLVTEEHYIAKFQHAYVFRMTPVALLMLALFPVKSQATDYVVDSMTPQDAIEITVSGRDNTLSGSFSNVSYGNSGYTNMTLGEAYDKGLLGTNSEYVKNNNIFNIGSQSKVIGFIDPVTGNTTSIAVYDNDAMVINSLADFNVTISNAVGANGQYIDRNLYNVNSGATLDVNVGSQDANWINDRENLFSAVFKSSNTSSINKASVFNVSSESGDKAELNYHSKTIAQLGNDYNNHSGGTAIAYPVIDEFTGEFTSKLGPQNVTNVEEFKAYNAALIAAIEKGELSMTSAEYNAELNLARTTGSIPIYANEDGIASDDAVRGTVNRDTVSYIHGTGKDAVINIDKDANLQLFWSDASLVNLENGATLINEGTLGSNNNTLRGAYVVAVHSGSVFENNGVVDAGTNPDMAEKLGSSAALVAAGQHTAILANGTSTVNNNATGVINLATSSSQYSNKGVLLSSSAVLTNDGTINVASTAQTNTTGTPVTTGVEAGQQSTFNHNGMLYIGREAQREGTDATNDLRISGDSIGVLLSGSATYNGDRASKIVIGSQTTNATAIVVKNTATLNQNGTIEINGDLPGESSIANVGINVKSGTGENRVVNNGVINQNGQNSIGIDVEAGGKITHAGVINVNSGVDEGTHYANYGIRASGEDALAVVSGDVNLNGDYAIGVQARDKGTITLVDDGTVTFNEGSHQTGYYIYGAGSSIIDNATSNQTVSTTDSTLYRVDGGAAFDGSSTNKSQMNATGDNSTIILTTDAGSSFNSGKLALSIMGEGSTGVRIEGGATGTITADADIVKVAGKGTTAGIVDGNYYGLDGEVVEAKKGESVLTSYATLETANTADGAFGYIARNGGTLNHKGTIDFDQSDSTGVLISGGTLNNDGDIQVNGVAVNIQGADSVVNNSATVSATDGTAAYLVGSDATLNLTGEGQTTADGTAHAILLASGAKGLVVDGATITMAAGGSGNAIENQANLVGIQLKETHITVGNGIGVHTGASMAQTNSGTINVTGSGTGILFESMDGSQTDQTLDMSDSRDLVINVQQAGGKGIVTNSSADLKTGASVNVLDSDGAEALVVGGTTKNIEQSGELTSVSTSHAVVDADNGSLESFLNKGVIRALDASQKALEIVKGKGIAFTNAAEASITGMVNLLSGDNTVTLESGSTATDITTGNGSDLFLLKDIKATETSLFTSLNGGEGEDTLRLQNAQYTLNSADAITGMEHIDLTSNSVFTVNNVDFVLGDAKDDAANTGYSIDTNSTLQLNATSDMAFNSHLSGTGTVSVDASGKAFDFTANNAADGFQGTLALQNSTFELAGLNTQALAKATLSAGEGSLTHVGKGEQNIGGLAFNGGTVSFDGVTPGKTQADGTIHAGKMDLSGRGTVQVDTGSVSNDRPQADTTLSLLEQDDAQELIKLATSDSAVQGGAGNLTLTDKDGNVISDGVVADIEQNDEVVAKGTYDYRLTGGENDDGLYISYGLTQVELLASGSNALVLDANDKTGNAADLSARVTGTGDLAFDSAKGQTVSLSNMDNDYTGITDVRSGNLLMNNNDVLGQTSELRLASDTGFDMNGYSQTVGKLTAAVDSLLNIHGGSLTIADGGEANGTLTGSGALNLNGGTLTVTGENSTMTAKTTIAEGATALLNSTLGLGTGDIVAAGTLALSNAAGVLYNAISDNGSVELTDSDVVLAGNNSEFTGTFDIDGGSQLTASVAEHLGDAAVKNAGSLVLNSASSWELNNSITGAGSVTKLGSGTITVGDNAAWTGSTHIEQGGLQLGSESASVVLSSSQVTIADQGKLSGFGGVTGDIDNAGLLQVGTAESTGTHTFTVGGNVTNSGTMATGVSGKQAGNQLVIKGNYAGNDGLLSLNTALGDDKSVTDKLVVEGDTSGNTYVTVTNAGGKGAATINGIEVITVEGASDGDFTQKGRIVAGAYDYTLNRGTGKSSSNWYLNSSKTDPGTDPGDKETPDLRPEGGSYTANLAAANTLIVTRLHDRLGETQFIDALTGEQKVTSMWMRHVGGHNNWRDGSGQLKTQSNRYAVQLGGDVAQWSQSGLDRWHLGLMAGYGNDHSNTHTSRTQYGSKGSVNGYSAGVYSTWYANDETHSGLYVDTWAQYNWFNNSVKGEGLQGESYKSKGVNASVETGYTWKMGEYQTREGSTNEWYIQPQAQAVWMGVKADDHRESNGTRITSSGDGNVQTRLGVKTWIKGHSQLDNGKAREFQPFAEVNWLHNTRDFSTRMDGVNVSQAGTKNLGEVKVGVEGQVSPRFNLWGNVGVQVGDKGYNDSAAMIGAKWNF